MTGEPSGPKRIETLEEIGGAYDALLCDVWGVLHDGERKSADAEAALLAARRGGRKVLLITNSPRPEAGVRKQLRELRVADEAYDAIVTSGDVTRDLIKAGGSKILHIGPDRDLELFTGLEVERVSEDEAEIVVATGLYNDETETPEDYAEQLRRLVKRGLVMICANPDILVGRGDRLIWCAGALARDYENLGGEVRLAGKPFWPIYDLSLRKVAMAPHQVLAIGDGLMTDIKGANAFGFDALLISGGIHAEAFGSPDAPPAAIARELAARSLTARYVMPALK